MRHAGGRRCGVGFEVFGQLNDGVLIGQDHVAAHHHFVHLQQAEFAIGVARFTVYRRDAPPTRNAA